MKTAATGMMKVGMGVKGAKLSLQIFKIWDWLTMHNVQNCKVVYIQKKRKVMIDSCKLKQQN